jgi:hypothetical protein
MDMSKFHKYEEGISENVIWCVVRRVAERMLLDHLAPHDLRRTCARLCHVNGGELEQIQFLLGHVSVLTPERYLGCKQNLEEPVTIASVVSLFERPWNYGNSQFCKSSAHRFIRRSFSI